MSPMPWTPSATVESVCDWLAPARSVVITTHSKPDGDAVGATVALARALRVSSPDREVTIVYAGPLPTWLNQIAGDQRIHHVDTNGVPTIDPDAVAILDTGSWSQLEELRLWLAARRDRTCIVDHHVQGDAEVSPRRLIRATAAAVCEPVCEVCVRLLGLPSAAALPATIATPIYTGLVSDTGWFRHSNVTPDVMRLASELLRAGVDHARLYATLEQSDRPARVRLLARALSSMEIMHHGRTALLTLTLQDFHDVKAEPGDSGGFADAPLAIASVRVVGVVTEASAPPKALARISLRSKELPDSVDVNAVARALGGGGHVRAAGARVSAPLREVRESLARTIESLLPPA